MGVPYITAHSGCEGTEQDSLLSVEKALALGADAVELDVRRAQDHVLRISHNPLTLEEYREKHTLEDVFTLIKDTGIKLNCDIKEAAALEDTLQLADEFGFGKDRLILSGCTSPEQLARDRSIVRRASVQLNLEEILKFLYLADQLPGCMSDFETLMQSPWQMLRAMPEGQTVFDRWLPRVVELAKLLEVDGINLPHWILSEQMAEAFRENGINFSVWTVNDAEKIGRCIRLGAQNVTSRTVRLALDTRSRCCGVHSGDLNH